MQPFIVNLIGLPSGKTEMSSRVNAEFFVDFGNADIVAADLQVDAVVVNHGATLDVRCSIQGTVTVPCDRCLDDLVIPVETGFEESYVPDGDTLDFGQEVYDFVCIALPLQRVHDEGGCNEETVKYLSK